MDRTKWKNRRLCVLLVAIVFLTGISYVRMEAGSVGTAIDRSSGKLYSDFFTQAALASKEHVDSEEVSGWKLFSETIETEDSERKAEDVETALLLVFLLAILPMLSHCNVKRNWRLMEVSKKKQNILIRYIHQKDGSK